MQKFLFSICVTALLLSSCGQDHTIQEPEKAAIGFADTFIDNSVQAVVVDPTTTLANLNDFSVFGFTGNGQIMDKQKVEKQNGTWTYTPIQYWTAGNTYTFAAIAPYSAASTISLVENVALGIDKITMHINFTNNGTTDLLYAAPAPIETDETFMASPHPVRLTFRHMLAKTRFTFVNAVGEGYYVKVKNIHINNAGEKSILQIENENVFWKTAYTNFTANYGNVNSGNSIAYNTSAESDNARLLIPTYGKTYLVTFTVELYSGSTLVGTYDHSTKIKDVAIIKGFSYNFKGTLTKDNVVDPNNPLKPIEFEVETVETWVEADSGFTVGDVTKP